jgi:hypothetical protein
MYQALAFCNDLKLAHYIKIPPRHTFVCQIVATLVNTFVAASIFNFQMSFPNVCTKDAAFRFICPGQTTFFTGAVFWGTLGPKHLFGAGKRYNLLLLGFPVGVMIPIGKLSRKILILTNFQSSTFCVADFPGRSGYDNSTPS